MVGILKSHWQFTRDGRYGSSLYPDSPTSMTSRPRPDMASLSAVSNPAISCWPPTKTWAVSLVGSGLCHACEFLEQVDLGPFVRVWGNVTSEVSGCPAGNQSHNQITSVGRRSRKGVQCTVTGWGCCRCPGKMSGLSVQRKCQQSLLLFSECEVDRLAKPKLALGHRVKPCYASTRTSGLDPAPPPVALGIKPSTQLSMLP